MQPTAAGRSSARFSEMHGALCSVYRERVAQCMRTVCEWFRKHNTIHLTLQIWTGCGYHVWVAMHEDFWKLHPTSESFWIKSRTGENTWKSSAYKIVQSSGRFVKQKQWERSPPSPPHPSLSGVDPEGARPRGGRSPPNKNIPGREYLFAPSKF